VTASRVNGRSFAPEAPNQFQAMAGVGHEERFPPPRLSAGYGFRKETIAGMRRNGRGAPIPAVRVTTRFASIRSDARAVSTLTAQTDFARSIILAAKGDTA